MPEAVLSTQEKEAITCFYSLDKGLSWTPNQRGLINLTYEIGETSFLTIFKQKNSDQLETLGQMIEHIPTDIPIARPRKGASGYTLNLNSGKTLLTNRLAGMHYVGLDHSDKIPIPHQLHKELAAFFWKLQAALSTANRAVDINVPQKSGHSTVQYIPEVLKPFSVDYPTNEEYYPDLVHGDLERQNILSEGNKVTGVVDLDAIRHGDILAEFSHFLFNHVFCDPEANENTADIYINELVKSGCIQSAHIPLIYRYVFQFSVNDILGFIEVSKEKPVDLSALVNHYKQALLLASTFFEQNTS